MRSSGAPKRALTASTHTVNESCMWVAMMIGERALRNITPIRLGWSVIMHPQLSTCLPVWHCIAQHATQQGPSDCTPGKDYHGQASNEYMCSLLTPHPPSKVLLILAWDERPCVIHPPPVVNHNCLLRQVPVVGTRTKVICVQGVQVNCHTKVDLI